MKELNLGKTSLKLSRMGLGCMAMSEFYGKPLSEKDGIVLIKRAVERGINFFDTADVYGYGRNEILVGRAVGELVREGVERSSLVIATKCGIIRDENDPAKRGIDNSYDYVITHCDDSLKRLGVVVGYIDLYYIHRIANGGAQVEEAMRAMADLLKAGKIKAVGLSEARPEVIERANRALLEYTDGVHQLAAVQTEYSLMTRSVESTGVLNLCRTLGITFIAYSPLSRALLTGEVETVEQFEPGDFRRSLPRFQGEHLVRNLAIVEAVQEIAEVKSCTTAQVALAWLMSKGNVIPIPGTTKESHLLSNIAAEQIVLTEKECERLNNLETADGYRYSEAAMHAYGFDDELVSPLSSGPGNCR